MNNQLSRNEKIKLLQDLQKGKINKEQLFPCIEIILAYIGEDQIAIIKYSDNPSNFIHKRFTDDTVSLLIQEVK